MSAWYGARNGIVQGMSGLNRALGMSRPPERFDRSGCRAGIGVKLEQRQVLPLHVYFQRLAKKGRPNEMVVKWLTMPPSVQCSSGGLLTVKAMAKGGTACSSGLVNVDDALLEVDGQSLMGKR